MLLDIPVVFPEYLQYRFFDGTLPKRVAVVIRMDAVSGGGFAVVQGCVRLDVIYILVILADFGHQAVGEGAASAVFLLRCGIEILPFPVDSALHDNRLARMRFHHPVDERAQALLDERNVRV